MSAHTPGPWVAVGGGSYDVMHDDPTGDLVCVASDLRSDADAQLFAAAPELLDAAQNTLDYYKAIDPERACLYDNLNPCGGLEHGSLEHWGGGPGCPLCSARAAITKAEGK